MGIKEIWRSVTESIDKYKEERKAKMIQEEHDLDIKIKEQKLIKNLQNKRKQLEKLRKANGGR